MNLNQHLLILSFFFLKILRILGITNLIKSAAPPCIGAFIAERSAKFLLLANLSFINGIKILLPKGVDHKICLRQILVVFVIYSFIPGIFFKK